jgi:hypothetical protein
MFRWDIFGRIEEEVLGFDVTGKVSCVPKDDEEYPPMNDARCLV